MFASPAYPRVAMVFASGLVLAACASAPVAPRAVAPAVPAPAAAPAAPAIAPGIIADQLRALYGKPTFVRNEADSELWRYDGEHCSAFFFFYHDGAGGSAPLTLKYMETDPKGAGGGADPACLNGIWARAQAAS